LSCHGTEENIASFDLYGLKLCHAFVSDSLCSCQLPGSVLFFSSSQEAYSPVVLANVRMAAYIQGCAPHQLLDVFKVVFGNMARECMRVSLSNHSVSWLCVILLSHVLCGQLQLYIFGRSSNLNFSNLPEK